MSYARQSGRPATAPACWPGRATWVSPNDHYDDAKEIAKGVRYKLCKYLVTARMH